MRSKMPTVRLENAATSVSRCRAPARNMDRDWVKTGWPDAECWPRFLRGWCRLERLDRVLAKYFMPSHTIGERGSSQGPCINTRVHGGNFRGT